MSPLLWMWLLSETSGSEDGGGESQCTEENSESPIEATARHLVGLEMWCAAATDVLAASATPGCD
jgi:hypothetical protein